MFGENIATLGHVFEIHAVYLLHTCTVAVSYKYYINIVQWF